MGVPKFFRWISERYPLTSQLITPNSIPTFDNLYLDMNGIIHNCSHPPSSEDDPHFRITEEQMILAIFSYIDFLFTKIKPQKVFFMAIDGVAPRAKMNQQRSRRFRTARDAREKREEAERKGEKLPEEKAFDSNCITPGTPFMARLSDHLKYYVRKRISEDAEWRNVKVILSGHDVPGEGEHKIQEFIRLSKAQPDYNPNTRHCLYGLDADLIMLGLLSHDPHFCLLREEVTFGRKVKKNQTLANSNMYLLHLSLLREYLDLEFSPVANQIPFDYDLERIIDDFILMSIFVGNDFLPHLPGLHINEGALELIWKIYKEILPTAGGYLNEHGTISLPRLQMMLDKLAQFERDNFEEEFAEAHWYKGKQEKEIAALEKARKKGKLIITKDQQKYLNQIKAFVSEHQSKPSPSQRLTIVNQLPPRDRHFVQDLADSLHLRCTWDEEDDIGQPLIVISFDVDESSPASKDGDAEETDEEWESEEDPESAIAIKRIFDKYSKAKVVDNELEDFEESFEQKISQKMAEWKRHYYKDKLQINWDKPEEMHPLIFCYVEGLQWVLNYYYKGVPSWGWFYYFHYAPKISDITGIVNFKFEFDVGKPFLPFQQLMGVLPADSQEHVPPAYRDLMYEETSPIIDFYPKDFDLDMNGKKADWEAVVKIPFINEERLLRTMASREHRLTPEERRRNTSGELATQFVYDNSEETQFPSSLPGFFPDLVACHCRAAPYNLPTLKDGIDLVLGLMDGVHLGASALAGFPSIATLPNQGSLGYHHVNVFQQESKNQSMVITITGKHDKSNTAEVAKRLLGQRIYHSWPYLQEGIVSAVSDDMFKYELQRAGPKTKIVSVGHDAMGTIRWKKEADRIEHHYSKRFAVIIGNVDVVIHVRPLKGLKRLDTGALVKDYEPAEKEIGQALQMAVTQVTFEDERYFEKDAPPLAQEFPNGEKVIFLGDMAYGIAGQVTNTTDSTLDISLAFFPTEAVENREFLRIVFSRPSSHYYPSHVLAKRLGISGLALSRITSTLMVQLGHSNQKTNIGLSLKFESKGLKVLGYSRKADRGWEFSEKTYQLLAQYKAAFPEAFQHLDQRGGDIVTSSELCPTAENPDQVVRDMHKWLKTNGVSDLDPVSLFAEQLEKDTVMAIEQLADHFRSQKSADKIKRAAVKGLPRQAVLKPSHSLYRLQGQKFSLGDRVVMVQDSAAGGVPLAMKGVVVGIGQRDIDVVWDVPFMGGETLGGRCSDYRGSTVPFTSCLNLTRPQFTVTSSSAPKAVGQAEPFKPQLGPRPVIAPNNYKPATAANRPTGILQNPNRSQHVPPAGNLQYGNAAKGVRQQPGGPPVPVSHQSRLQGVLSGGQQQQPGLRQFPAQRPHIKPVSPTSLIASLPQLSPTSANRPLPTNGAPGPAPPPANGGNAPHRGGHGHRGGGGRGGGAGRGGPGRGRGGGRGGRGGRGGARGGAGGAGGGQDAPAPPVAAPSA